MSSSSNSSSNYPLLYGDAPATAPDFSTSSVVVYPQITAPALDEHSNMLLAVHNDRYDRLCAVCAKGIGVALGGGGGSVDFAVQSLGVECTLTCQHKAHLNCLHALAMVKKIPISANFGGLEHCRHCRELSLAGLIRADAAVSRRIDPQTSREFCLEQLKQEHTVKFKDGGFGAAGNDIPQLKVSDVREMLGYQDPTALQRVSAVVGKKLTGNRIVSYFGLDFGELDDDDDDDNAAPAAPVSTHIEPPFDNGVMHDAQQFISAMKTRKRTIDDVFATMHFTAAHLRSAGVQTPADLRELGFVPARHLLPTMRAVMPVFFLAEKIGITFAADLADRLTVNQLLACQFTRNEMVALEINAAALAARHLQVGDIQRWSVQSKLSLDDWLRYADLQISHAIQMQFTASAVVATWSSELRHADSRAYAFYTALCAATGEVALPASEFAVGTARQSAPVSVPSTPGKARRERRHKRQ